MLITREVSYALRILRALYVEGRMTTSALCEKEKIPKAFAYKIIRKLTAAGYLTTDRGADGGVQMRTDLAGEESVRPDVRGGFSRARQQLSQSGLCL